MGDDAGGALAAQARTMLAAALGAELACVVLRVATRHGRLYPGLAPPITGPVVNSESGDTTPFDQLPWLCWFEGVMQRTAKGRAKDAPSGNKQGAGTRK
jgi:hypothetical protein